MLSMVPLYGASEAVITQDRDLNLGRDFHGWLPGGGYQHAKVLLRFDRYSAQLRGLMHELDRASSGVLCLPDETKRPVMPALDISQKAERIVELYSRRQLTEILPPDIYPATLDTAS